MMRSVQDILLQHEIPNKISKSYVHKRWSQECGEEAVLELRTLSYDRVEEIKELHQKETSVYIVLEGVVAPDFRSKELREKYGCETTVDLIQRLLLPGEIEDISREIEKLSGYRVVTLKEIKKK